MGETPLDKTMNFRLTGEEKEWLRDLAKRRAQAMAGRGEVPDDTVNGLLRSLIRREARAAGLTGEREAGRG